MKISRLLAVAFLLVTSSVAAATVRLGGDVVPLSEAVALSVDPRKDDFTGSVKVELEVKKPTSTFRFHAEELTVTSMALVKGKAPIDVEHHPQVLRG